MNKLVSLLFAALSTAATIHAQDTPAWQKFVDKADDNVLLDFSYAGYNHGLSLPVDGDVQTLAKKLGYKIYNVCDYGAVPDDGKSDRDAFLKVLKAIGNPNANANAIIYFPEGEFILHSKDDDTFKEQADGTKKQVSNRIDINMGHLIIKGAGRDKTTIAMDAEMQPTDPKVMYSSPHMMQVRNNGGGDDVELAKVTGSAKKNDMSIEVDDASKLKVGDWVKLHLLNADKKVIDEELLGHEAQSSMTNLLAGVEVIDRHQIKSIDGNVVTFEEPIMHAVNPDYGWTIKTYAHYEEVGIEDLKFLGYSTEFFHHHASWRDDGAYKPLQFTRCVNSWMRRVDFESISECMTFQDCANSLCIDVEISGNRGHSSIRMANSARGFIGMVYDHSDGYLNSDASFLKPLKNLGQYHACGISKHSIGNVIWRCKWGDDSCFESHATQPRASLFDMCSGGFMRYRMGGDKAQIPNHLDDLTIWNFNCLAKSVNDNPFNWWVEDIKEGWYKVLPPTMVGFHGKEIKFKDDQMKLNENQGKEVTPGSLYVAQMQHRLGYIPEWITYVINNGGTGTGIENVTTVRPVNNKTYNLQGIEVGDGYKGVVIKNGKKIVR